MNYKVSKYNIFVPYKDGNIIIYNPLSGAIGKFTPETFERYHSNKLHESEVELLIKKGVLVKKNVNEIDKIHCDRKRVIDDEKFKHFRIWPTSACNAHCYYCFEKGIQIKTMSFEIADSVVNFINKNSNYGDKLSIEWFGGEPLLNFKIIDYIYNKLNPICEQKNCSLSGSIISNGSLINQALIEKITTSWHIHSIQITLDGYGDYYENVKQYSDPIQYNYRTVVDAIKNLSIMGVRVSVRMNYDMTNYSHLVELIKNLHEELKGLSNISYYIYPLWSSIDEKYSDKFVSNAKADKRLLNIFDLLIEYGMSTPKKISSLNYKRHSCFAWSKNSYTILPDGKICKCAETYNQIIGDIWNGVTDKELYDYWTNWELDNKCLECVYLPICQGGCKASHFTQMPQCFALKEIIKDIIFWYVEKIEN